MIVSTAARRWQRMADWTLECNPGSTELRLRHVLGNVLGDDNIGPGSDRVRKQYWAKIVQNFATRAMKEYHLQ